jgi:DNA mismatch repair protein MutS2
VRNGRRVIVAINGRAVEFDAAAVRRLDPAAAAGRRTNRTPASESSSYPVSRSGGAIAEADLHGLTVAEALVRVEHLVNEALLAGLPELRLIHGRGGGRLRASLHVWLRGIPTVRAFRLDARNPGVTVVTF